MKALEAKVVVLGSPGKPKIFLMTHKKYKNNLAGRDILNVVLCSTV